MAMMINEDCISCDACIEECPNGAISEGADLYRIDPDLCTECAGITNAPQCVDVCPADCIVKDPKHAETKQPSTEDKEKVHINW